ncbi:MULTISPECIES: gluconeogenesis factor YvcK family protein [Shouchella]|uniref:Gluconeogenesis factor n=2 Tax=Shouchella TaxID=2893057 RepID=A0ABY7W9U0_9BACI|nr:MULTISPECIES: YvcK family protein [Shouchella]MED4129074.1 YvcK family protein [Shouchella miscanthi]WDF04409.1 YvcK family protein [Shouchella hunanensis]
MRKKVVVIGGGTGLSVILKGLKTYPVDITAIVTVADDGGSSGILRKELDIPPPGDVRNVLVALAEVEPLVEELFQHRFASGDGLNGHSLGNLLLAGMTSITGDFQKGIATLSRVLNVRGSVLPAANKSIILHAEMEDGTHVSGESKIPLAEKKIKRVYLTPKDISPLSETLHALKTADLIVLGPGSLYTSILPNLLVPGIVEAIMTSKAKRAYICNVMTQAGETDHYAVSDHVQAILTHCQSQIVQHVLVNHQQLTETALSRYRMEKAEQVVIDETKLKELGVSVIKDQFVVESDYKLRHDAKRVSEALLSLLDIEK